MKKLFTTSILFFVLLFSYSYQAKAIKAYPFPITVAQPDGTSLTIQIHGDEFLNWTTCGNKLVSKGDDGFYYISSFNQDGRIIRSSSRVSSSTITLTSSSSIVPPPIAFSRAQELRSKVMKARRKGGMKPSSGGSISLGNNPFLVLLVQFPSSGSEEELSFTIDSPNDAFSNLLNQENYSYNGGTGSVRDYFKDNSHNLFDPDFEVIGPLTVSKPYSYYGDNNHDERYIELIVEMCELADKQGLDFSRYDNNGDGDIDNVFFYFAGHNEAEGGGDETIWPHSWNVAYFQNLYLDGKRLTTYACASEYSGASGTRFCGIGTFCHEFGHVLGLPDFYDTDYETNGDAPGLYSFSLMCVGCYNNNGKTPPYLNTIEKNMLEWMERPRELSYSGSYTLEGVSDNNAYIFPTKNENEFYLIENRKDEGWDHYLPGQFGMLIYHIDASSNNVKGVPASYRWENWYGINSVAGHECFDLVAAKYPEKNIYENQIPFPGTSGNTNFTGTSSPASKSWANVETGYNISEIAFNGEIVSFKLLNTNTDQLFDQLGYNAIDNPKTTYSVGDPFVFKLITSSRIPQSRSFTFNEITVAEGDTIILGLGEHTIKAFLTYEDGSTETLIQLIKAQ